MAFSSDRSGRWAVYVIGQTDSNETVPATEVSQVSGHEAHDDYGPSFSDDGNVLVFNRDNQSIESVYVSDGASSVCDLYNPPGGLAAASADNGAASRIVFDPADPTKLVYVAGNNQIHLLTGHRGRPPPARPAPPRHRPTPTCPPRPRGAPLGPTQADANPDWSPDGTKIIFDSTRSGGHSLWYFSNPDLGQPHRHGPLALFGRFDHHDGYPAGLLAGRYAHRFHPAGHAERHPGHRLRVGHLRGAAEQRDGPHARGGLVGQQPSRTGSRSAPFPTTPEAPMALAPPRCSVCSWAARYVLIRNRRRLNLRTVST